MRYSERSGEGCCHLRTLRLAVSLIICCLLLTECHFPGSVTPTIKIGLSAPFEGLDRSLGYEALYAVRLAVRQRNASGGVNGIYLVELVALNDYNEPAEARLQAREMAADPDVLGVIGGWSPESAVAAAPEYDRLNLAFLAPEGETIVSLPDVRASPEFVQAYQELSGGAPPGTVAEWAYTEANRLLDALDAAGQAERRPTRAGVLLALSAGG